MHRAHSARKTTFEQEEGKTNDGQTFEWLWPGFLLLSAGIACTESVKHFISRRRAAERVRITLRPMVSVLDVPIFLTLPHERSLIFAEFVIIGRMLRFYPCPATAFDFHEQGSVHV